jgi:hypothetical protein
MTNLTAAEKAEINQLIKIASGEFVLTSGTLTIEATGERRQVQAYVPARLASKNAV